MRRRREAEHDRQALGGIRRARHGTEAFWITRNVLEQDGGRVRLPIDDLGQRAHLELPVGAFDAQELARALEAVQRLAKIAVRAGVLVPGFYFERLVQEFPRNAW